MAQCSRILGASARNMGSRQATEREGCEYRQSETLHSAGAAGCQPIYHFNHFFAHVVAAKSAARGFSHLKITLIPVPINSTDWGLGLEQLDTLLSNGILRPQSY